MKAGVKCANENDIDYKLLVKYFGNVGAYKIFLANDQNQPLITRAYSDTGTFPKSVLFEDLRAKYGEEKAVIYKAMTYMPQFKEYVKNGVYGTDENGEHTIETLDDFIKNNDSNTNLSDLAFNSNLSANYISQIQNVAVRNVMRGISENKKVSVDVVMKDLQKHILDLMESTTDPNYKALLKEVDRSWAYLRDRIDERLKEVNVIQASDTDPNGYDVLDDSESEGRNYDQSVYEINNIYKVGANLRRFLSDIDDYYGNKVKTSLIGLPMAMNFEQLFAELKRITYGKGADFNTLIATMENYRGTLPWMGQVIDKLTSAPLQLRKQFSRAMSNSYTNAVRVRIYNEDKKTKVVADSVNSNSAKTNTLNKWQTGLQTSGLVKSNEESLTVMDSDAVKAWAGDFAGLQDSDDKTISEWLSKAGIQLHPQTLPYLRKNGVMFGKKNYDWDKMFTSRRGFFSALVTNVSKQAVSLEARSPIYGGIFDVMAELDASFLNQANSGAYLDNKKNIYPFNNNNALKIKKRELMAGDVNRLLALPYSSSSFWAKQIATNDDFAANFDVQMLSQSPIGYRDSDRGDVYADLTNNDRERLAVGLMYGSGDAFHNRLGGGRVIHTIGMSTGKPVPTVYRSLAMDVSFNNDGTLSNPTLRRLYEQLVLPDIRRSLFCQNNPDIASQTKEFKDGGIRFYSIPEMNKVAFVNGVLRNDIESIDFIEGTIYPLLKEHINKLAEKKVDEWNYLGIAKDGVLDCVDTDVAGRLASEYGISGIDMLAKDYVTQYLVAHANELMLFAGDPAGYYHANTFDNIGKRLAGMVGPREDQDNGGNIKYMVLADREVSSENMTAFREMMGKNSKPYEKINSTDGQEYWTMLEALRYFNDDGAFPDGFYDAVSGIIRTEIASGNHNYSQAIRDGLNKEYRDVFNNFVFQTQKGVYFGNDTSSPLNPTIYLKSSAIVLTPEMNSDLDKVRVLLEKSGADRGIYESAVKQGKITATKVFDGNEIVDAKAGEFLDVPRMGYGRQTNNPQHSEHTINRVGQALQNIFVNGLDVEFEWKGVNHTGKELRDKLHGIVGKLYEQEYQKLLQELEFDGNKINTSKLKKLLMGESQTAGYSIAEANAMMNNIRYLPYDRLSYKHEQFLNSVVYNRVLRLRISGHAGILASGAGLTGGKAVDKYTGQTVFTDKYDPQKGLRLYKREDYYVAQVVMPWTFKANIEDYIKDGFIDTSKFEKGMLDGFGMRIPNPGVSSQMLFEVVGFTAKNMGDAVFAPDEMIKRTGWDFDNDKLYTYIFEHSVVNGVITKRVSDVNDLIDIHMAVHKSAGMQAMINTPLSSDEYENIANKVYKETRSVSPLSEQYQKNKIEQGLSAKDMVGIYASFSSLHGMAQGRGLMVKKKGGFKMVFDGVPLDGTLFENPHTANAINTTIQAALDNEKLQVLHKTNDNPDTAPVTLALYALGAGGENMVEYAIMFRKQPIIEHYLDAKKRLGSDKAALAELAQKWGDKKANTEEGIEEWVMKKTRGLADKITLQDLRDAVDGKVDKDKQMALLDRFIKLRKIGNDIFELQRGCNVYSRGFGKNINEATIKEIAVNKLVDIPIENAISLLGEMDINGALNPKTIAGYAVKYGLQANQQLWSSIYPYKTKLFAEILTNWADIAGKNPTAEDRDDIFKAWKSFIFTSGKVNGVNHKAYSRLFIGKDSLAHRLHKMKKDNPNNAFLSRLSFNLRKDNMPSTYNYRASLSNDVEAMEIEKTLAEWQVLNKELFEDIMTAEYLKGGVQTSRNLIKYLPWNWVYQRGIVKELNNFDYNDTSLVDTFITQYFQNYPEKIADKLRNYDGISGDEIIWDKTDNDGNLITPRFIAKYRFDRVKQAKKRHIGIEGWVPFALSEIRDGYAVYKMLPVLGYGYDTEFNANANGFIKSAVEINNPEFNMWQPSGTLSTMTGDPTMIENDAVFEKDDTKSVSTESVNDLENTCG